VLLVVTVTWGFTFTWMKDALEVGRVVLGDHGDWPAIGLFMSMRFGLAALVLPVVLRGAFRGLGRASVKGGSVIGALLTGGFLLQLWALPHLSAAVSAFLTSLYVFFTVCLMVAVERRAPRWGLLLGATLASFGSAFIDGPPHLTFGLPEAVTVGCAFCFALHILATDAYTKVLPPAVLTEVSFVFSALAGVAVLGATLSQVRPGGLLALALAPAFLEPVVLSSLLATVLALTLMNFFQRALSPVRAAVLYALEPIWAALVAYGLRGVEPGSWLPIGGAALLLGNLVAGLGARQDVVTQSYPES
jgi:drug/metabolite transporter (DMT)-like permease